MKDIKIGDTVHVQMTFKVTGMNESSLYECVVVSGEVEVPYKRVKAPVTIPIQYAEKLDGKELFNA